MRILAALTYYHPHWTGLTAHAQQLAEGLARRGHAVTVLAYRHGPALAADDWHRGVRIVRAAPVARLSRGMVGPAYLGAVPALLREADVLMVHTPMLEAAPLVLAARAAGRASVIVHHGDLLLPAGAANRVVERLVTAGMAAAARLADAVTAYSEDYADHSDFLTPLRPKLVAIAPPVDIPVPTGRRRRLAGATGARRPRRGRFRRAFVEEKGVDVLLRALPLLRAREPRAHLVYAGDPHLVYERFYERCASLRERVAEQVTEVGLLTDRQQLADFYALCDVLALPSRSDCFALVQAEAMRCGTPVVASAIPGAREPVRWTGMGRLVTPGDPAALADGLAAVLRAPAAYRRDPAAIAARFDRERCLDAYERSCSACSNPARRRCARSFRCASGPALDALAPGDRAPVATRLRERPTWPTVAACRSCSAGWRRQTASACSTSPAAPVSSSACCATCAPCAPSASMRTRPRWPPPAAAAAPRRWPTRGSSTCRSATRPSTRSSAPRRWSTSPTTAPRCASCGACCGPAARSRFRCRTPIFLAWDPISRVRLAVGAPVLDRDGVVGIGTGHLRLYWPEQLRARVSGAGFAVERLELATHYAVPFAHQLVYGLGKALLQRGTVGAGGRAAVLARPRGPGDRLVAAGRRVFAAVDRLNERPAAARRRTFVNVLLLARRV
ncbi:MAG: glycosyltransferase family 4 protein [Candidatus Binatia bacterium]